jgi:hypothetical protein
LRGLKAAIPATLSKSKRSKLALAWVGGRGGPSIRSALVILSGTYFFVGCSSIAAAAERIFRKVYDNLYLRRALGELQIPIVLTWSNDSAWLRE